MDFGIIFTVDVWNYPDAPNLSAFYASPRLMRKLTMTESDDAYTDWGTETSTRHRKYAGTLTKEEFKQFVSETSMYAETTRTMGAIGMPGCGLGCAPAISFDGPDFSSGAIVNAYVTPLPDVKLTEENSAERWERIRDAVLRQFGD